MTDKMREILFRGKSKDGVWLVGHYSDDTACDADFPCIAPLRSEPYDGDWEVLPDTVGQYVGLTDRNGKKIFEGDILKSHWDEDYPEDFSVEVVLWYENGWYIRQGTFSPDSLSGEYEDGCLKYSEVIGNVHDNPELLEEA